MPSSLAVSYFDFDDLFGKWATFAVANGWTLNEFEAASSRPGLNDGLMSLSKGTMFGGWRWNLSFARVFHFQALGFGGVGGPGTHLDDAGPNIGPFDTPTTNGRGTIMTNAAGTADFFSGTEGGQEYLAIIAESGVNSLLFRMWMIGEIIKVGDWTGGEFLASQSWPCHNSISADSDAAFDKRNKTMFDGFHDQQNQGCTIHLENIHGFGGKWGQLGSSASVGQDRSGAARIAIEGPARDGPTFNATNWLTVQPNNGFVPLQPYPMYLRQGGQWTLLGYAPGIRGLRITFISPKEEFLAGADTWRAYPWVKKSFANTNTPESDDQGLAILKTP